VVEVDSMGIVVKEWAMPSLLFQVFLVDIGVGNDVFLVDIWSDNAGDSFRRSL
jgi:hypothetical protein